MVKILELPAPPVDLFGHFEFTVRRSEWTRGALNARLYRELKIDDDQTEIGRCCLGFACNALGIEDSDIKNRSTVDGLVRTEVVRLLSLGPLGELVAQHGSELFPSKWASRIMELNDTRLGTKRAWELNMHTGADRELMLTETFAEKNVSIHFVD